MGADGRSWLARLTILQLNGAKGDAKHNANVDGVSLVPLLKDPKATLQLKGFGGASVLEVVEDHDGSTYRAVYTIRLAGVVYALHIFQKKSKRGVKSPKQEIELIRKRLEAAEEHYANWSKEQESEGAADKDDQD